MKKYVLIGMSAFAGAFIALGASHYLFKKETSLVSSSTIEVDKPIVKTNFSQVANFNFDENSFVKASDKTVHSVVHVKNMTVAPKITSIFDLFYGNGASEGGKERLAGTGSGVIISPDGYIITNDHVIDGASSIQVTLNDNKTYKAELVGTDPSTDIALLKIKREEPLPYLTFADSDNTKVGEWVLAVGNPFNLTSTVTAGIISAKARNLSSGYSGRVDSYIQTDAAVNSGNSGGALVNLNGDLIGINTAIASANTGTFVGYSFAVPSNIAKKVVEDLIEYGNVQKGILGVKGIALDSETAEKLSVSQTEGFYIDAVEQGSGADKAGIKKGDIIKEVDNTHIRTYSDLTGYINTKRPNDKVQVTILRNGKEQKIAVTLQKNTTYRLSNLGLEVKELTKEDKKQFRTEQGVKVTDAAEYYKMHGFDMIGKVLININNQEVKDIEHLKKIVAKFNKNTRNSMVVINQSGEKERFFF